MDLVQQARKGREAAFLELFDEHHLPLYRFAYRLTGSAADAEDIVQECFLQLLKPSSTYDPQRTAIRTYLFGVVRNQSLRRLPKSPLRDVSTGPPTPEMEALRSEVETVVSNAIGMLPETQREVLILAHYEQMPLAEIAVVVDIEITAVKSRLQRARESLRQSLAAYVAPERRQ